MFTLSKKQYQQALDYYKSAKNLFEQEGLEELFAEVCLNEAKVYQIRRLQSSQITFENRYTYC